MDRVLTRGDDYWADRPVWTVTLVGVDPLDPDNLTPFDLTGCTVRSTWRPGPIPPGEDASDTTAALAASIAFDGNGDVTASSHMILPPDSSASDGVLLLVADRATTTAMPLTAGLRGDVQITDAADKVVSVPVLATLALIDLYTSAES